MPHVEHFQLDCCETKGFSAEALVTDSAAFDTGVCLVGPDFGALQMPQTVRLERLTFPHDEHFQFEGPILAAFCSGGLVAGSIVFGMDFRGTKVGHAVGAGFGGGRTPWIDCGGSSGSSSLTA